MVWAVGALILVALVWGWVRSGRVRGWLGELRTRFQLAIWFPRSHRLHDVYLLGRQGTVQIDHVMINRRGVFVLETKNWGGWIFGEEGQRYWTKVYRDGSKYRQLNPLEQNRTHANAVIRVVRVGHVVAFVVMVGNGVFKTAKPPQVVSVLGLRLAVWRHRRGSLSVTQVAQAAARLQEARLAKSRRLVKEHAAHVRRRRAVERPR